jgi:branched-chain amino acid aminotransferase
MKIYIDGQYFDEENAKISVFDHGLLYGDGIFEGIRAYNGRVFKLKEHIDRLFYSAKAILLTIPISHGEMMKVVVETCRENGLRDGYIRLIVTRGVGTLGLNPNKCKRPSVICIADKIEANNGGCEDAIMLNSDGYVAECTGDNIFIVKGDELLTPPLSAGALYGITRGVAIELAREIGLKVSEPNLTRYDIFNADECFVTGTGAEVVPVVKVDGRVIGSGKPGPRTQELVKRYHQLVQSSGEPI